MVVAVEGASNESRSTSELEGFAFGAAAVEAGSALDDAADALVVDAPEEVFDVDAVDFDLSLEWDLAEAAEEGVAEAAAALGEETAEEEARARDESTRRSSNPRAAMLGCNSGTHSLREGRNPL